MQADAFTSTDVSGPAGPTRYSAEAAEFSRQVVRVGTLQDVVDRLTLLRTELALPVILRRDATKETRIPTQRHAQLRGRKKVVDEFHK